MIIQNQNMAKNQIVLYGIHIHCLIVYTKADNVYKDIGEDFETRFNTSNYELDSKRKIAKRKK